MIHAKGRTETWLFLDILNRRLSPMVGPKVPFPCFDLSAKGRDVGHEGG